MSESEQKPPAEEQAKPEKDVQAVPGKYGIKLRKGLQARRPKQYGPPPTDQDHA